MGGLNFTIVELVPDPENPPDGLKVLDHTASRSQAEEAYEDAVVLPDDADDQGPDSEWAFKRRVDAEAEGRLAQRYGCHHSTGIPERYHQCRDIRQAGGRIARRLREAGVVEGDQGVFMFNAMQAAVAQDRKEVVEVLKEKGAEMPIVIAMREEDCVKEAEGWARRLRGERSIYCESRKTDGGGAGSSVGMNFGYVEEQKV